MIKTSLSTEDQEYKVVNAGNAHDSDEEQLKQEHVISQDEQPKEQEQQEEITQISQQQGSPQKKQPQTPPQTKLVEINSDYQEIDVKVKWQDRVRINEPCKFSKKHTIEINEPVLFTMEKKNTKHGRGFFQSLFSSDYRYIYFLDGYLVMLYMRNDQILVKSHTELSRLFKIIVKTNSIILCFINEQLDQRKSPKVKQYDFLKGIEQKGKLLMKLRGELNKIGLEYEIRK